MNPNHACAQTLDIHATARLPADDADLSADAQLADIVLSAENEEDLAQALDEALMFYANAKSAEFGKDGLNAFAVVYDFGVPLEVRKRVLERLHGIVAGRTLAFAAQLRAVRPIPHWLVHGLLSHIRKGAVASQWLSSVTEEELAPLNARQQAVEAQFAEWHRQAVETGAPVFPFGGLDD